MNKNFYLTTTLPYVNALPHIGTSVEMVQADAICRLKRYLGYNVVFNTGTDEHGQKIYQKATEEGKTPQDYTNYLANIWKNTWKNLNISYTHFIRTTNDYHIEAAKEFWKICEKNGDIYKAKYKVKYCVDCELEKQDSDLENGKCPFHPNKELQTFEEENYYFRFSKYQKPLLKFYENTPDFVTPNEKFNEIKSFVSSGLKDFSISRLKSKMPWGIEVPGDKTQVMYVWFDALINYISTLGWPENVKNFNAFWPGLQTAGKDNLRQQSAMWQAMLMSANLPTSKKILIHGFITIDGQKISKSLGNTFSPEELINEFGSDAVRYYLLSEIPVFIDGDFSKQRLIEKYNSDLANGIGNLVARLTKLAQLTDENFNLDINNQKNVELEKSIEGLINKFDINSAVKTVFDEFKKLDGEIQIKKPWENVKTNKKFIENTLNKTLYLISLFEFVTPNLKQNVFEKLQIESGKFEGKIKTLTGLFPRIK